MNVPVVTLPVGASGTVTAMPGQGDAKTADLGLGQLFSLQIGFALQNAQEEELSLNGQGLSEEELQAMDDLMAMLSQLLVIQQENEQGAQAFLADSGKQVEQLVQKLQGPLPELTNEWKQLLSKMTQQEPAVDETQRMLALLQNYLGDKGAEQAKRAPLARPDAIPVGAGMQEMSKLIQPLRINHGLQAYKQEAGIQTQAVQVLQTAATLGQEQTDSLTQSAISASVPVASGNGQTAPLFQMSSTARTYPVPANQFPEQVTQIFVKQMNLTQANGLHEAKLVLHPQSLGQVNVTITSHNGVITAQFTAETKAGRELLDNQMLNLRTALVQNGLQVDRLEVSQQQASDNLNFQQQQREQAKQQQEQQSRQQEQQNESEFVLESLVDEDETASAWEQLRAVSRGVDDVV